MFFVFYILVMINYIPLTNNYVLKRINHKHDDHVVQPEVCNNSFHFSTRRLILGLQESLTNTNNSKPNTLNLHHYDKKLTNEMLSIKPNNNDKRFQTLKHADMMGKILKSKEKLSSMKVTAVDTDLPNINDFDFSRLFPEEKYVETSNNAISVELKIPKNVEEKDRPTKNKVVDLRSLTGHGLVEENNEPKIKAMETCTCNSSQINTRALGFAGHNFQTIVPTAPSGRCNRCSRTTVSYSLLPYYMPYQPYYYQANMFHTASKLPVNEDLFFEDDKHSHFENDSDEDEVDEEVRPEKSHKRKKHRHRKKYKTTVADDNHIIKLDPEKFEANDAFLDHDNKLAKEILNDISALYPDNAKKCYCSSGTAFSYLMILLIVSILFTFSNTFVKFLWQN